MSFSQNFGDVRSRARQGIVGGWALRGGNSLYATGWNADPQAAQVSTLTVDTATGSHTYGVTVNGVEITYTAESSTTVGAVASGLADAVNAEPLVRGQVAAEANGAVVTLTGTYPGVAFTLTGVDAKITAATTTSADEADPIGFGLAVISDGRVSDEGEQLVKLAKSASLTAQVVTLALTYAASANVGVAIYEVRGDERHLLAQASHVMATDLGTSLTAIAARLNALLPASSVGVTEDGTDLTFTAEIAGLEFDVEVSVSNDAVAPDIEHTTGPDASTSIHRAMVGVSLYSEVDPAAQIAGAEGQYAANAGVLYAQRGEVWVESAESPAAGGAVYLELAGDAAGQFYASSSSTRVALARASARWVRDGINATDGLAALRIDL